MKGYLLSLIFFSTLCLCYIFDTAAGYVHCGNLFCYGSGAYCCHRGQQCCYYVWSLWWFWVTFLVLLILMMACSFAIRSRSKKRVQPNTNYITSDYLIAGEATPVQYGSTTCYGAPYTATVYPQASGQYLVQANGQTVVMGAAMGPTQHCPPTNPLMSRPPPYTDLKTTGSSPNPVAITDSTQNPISNPVPTNNSVTTTEPASNSQTTEPKNIG